MSTLDRVIALAKDAQNGAWPVQSTGEQLVSALVLNRPDWLAQAGYTMAEAIDRVGPEWLALIPAAARALLDEENQ